MTEPVICEVVITAGDAARLVDFTRSLVEDRLAACGHNIEVIRSVFRWDGAVQDEREARVSLHTRLALVDSIVERANEKHPYDVPCVIALPVVNGNPGVHQMGTLRDHRAVRDDPASCSTPSRGNGGGDTAPLPGQNMRVMMIGSIRDAPHVRV
jgi:periplasmic divalent cation tolerance protein